MTNASTTMRAPTIRLSGGDASQARPGALVIAAGTPFEIAVRDARSIIKWSVPGGGLPWDVQRRFVYHHTAGGPVGQRSSRSEVLDAIAMSRGGRWGLPYNFLVMPARPWRIYYLNDVDQRWPHTWGHNDACAIAAWGNFSVSHPSPPLVGRMVALADALATMWGVWCPESQHRDHIATECPGNHLAPLLPSEARQRGL